MCRTNQPDVIKLNGLRSGAECFRNTLHKWGMAREWYPALAACRRPRTILSKSARYSGALVTSTSKPCLAYSNQPVFLNFPVCIFACKDHTIVYILKIVWNIFLISPWPNFATNRISSVWPAWWLNQVSCYQQQVQEMRQSWSFRTHLPVFQVKTYQHPQRYC